MKRSQKTTINIQTPQFKRSKKLPNPVVPKTDAEFHELIKGSTKQLKDMGFCPWDEPINGKQLWLIPGEWYGSIPDGFSLISIGGKREKFKRGVTDNDTRSGLLAYGIEVRL
jgi:hypothetical protein